MCPSRSTCTSCSEIQGASLHAGDDCVQVRPVFRVVFLHVHEQGRQTARHRTVVGQRCSVDGGSKGMATVGVPAARLAGAAEPTVAAARRRRGVRDREYSDARPPGSGSECSGAGPPGSSSAFWVPAGAQGHAHEHLRPVRIARVIAPGRRAQTTSASCARDRSRRPGPRARRSPPRACGCATYVPCSCTHRSLPTHLHRAAHCVLVGHDGRGGRGEEGGHGEVQFRGEGGLASHARDAFVRAIPSVRTHARCGWCESKSATHPWTNVVRLGVPRVGPAFPAVRRVEPGFAHGTLSREIHVSAPKRAAADVTRPRGPFPRTARLIGTSRRDRRGRLRRGGPYRRNKGAA